MREPVEALELFVKINGKYFPVSAVLPSGGVVKKVKIQDAIQNYLNICTSQKCVKNQKVELRFFERFAVFLIKKGLKNINEVSYQDILEFQNQLSAKMKSSSVNRRICTIKNFFVMCERWRFTIKNEAKEIKKKRVESNPYKNWTEKEFKKFISLTSGVRRALFKFLWQTGCRPVEAKNLKWTDIDYDNNEIIFNCGKNSSINRKFPMTNSISKILHSLKVDSLYVFTEGKKQINNDALYHYAKSRLKSLGFNHISIYGIRHSFAERLAKANVSPFYIQKLMGHSDMKTTMGYLHDDKNNLKDVLNLIKY